MGDLAKEAVQAHGELRGLLRVDWPFPVQLGGQVAGSGVSGQAVLEALSGQMATVDHKHRRTVRKVYRVHREASHRPRAPDPERRHSTGSALRDLERRSADSIPVERPGGEQKEIQRPVAHPQVGRGRYPDHEEHDGHPDREEISAREHVGCQESKHFDRLEDEEHLREGEQVELVARQ